MSCGIISSKARILYAYGGIDVRARFSAVGRKRKPAVGYSGNVLQTKREHIRNYTMCFFENVV